MNTKSKTTRFTWALALASVFAGTSLQAELLTVHYSQPTLDKWVYPFAVSGGGNRTSAPTFGSFGDADGYWDDRDGQFLVGYNTSGAIPAGLGLGAYQIVSAQLTITMSVNAADIVQFDGSYDSASTYNPADGSSVGDTDSGRPIELYGVGYRNGYTALTLTETAPYSFGNPMLEGVRNFYATDSLGGGSRDVSNNIRDAFDPVPFAIGQVASGFLNMDGTIQGEADIVFTLNLSNPDVLAYLESALHIGQVNLMVSSLHTGSQNGTPIWPDFDTKELGAAGSPARLDLQVNVVPEAETALLLGLGIAILSLYRKRK